MCVEWDFEALSPKRDVFIKPFPLAQGSMWNKRQKTYKSQRISLDDPKENNVLPVQQNWYTYEFSDYGGTYRAWTDSNQMGSQQWEGEVDMESHA